MKTFLSLFNLQTISNAKKSDVYIETLRKTKAFYFSMIAMVAIFIYGSAKGYETTHIINAISNLALSYIVGVSAIDVTRSYRSGKFESINTPEKQEEIQERYRDR